MKLNLSRRNFVKTCMGSLIAACSKPLFAAVPPLTLQPVKTPRITVLVENMAGGAKGYEIEKWPIGEWGLSFWIEVNGTNILFDTGRGNAIVHNAKVLNIDLRKTNIMALSHHHIDHTGGVSKVMDSGAQFDLYAHPDLFQPRYWTRQGEIQEMALPFQFDEKQTAIKKIVKTKTPTEIADGVYVTGEVPRRTEFEPPFRGGYLDKELSVRDRLLDDMAIFFKTENGLVLLVGCAHAGVVNTMNYVSELTGEKSFHTVVGGTHLLRASKNRMKHTIDALGKYDVQQIMLMHCTGLDAYHEIAKAYPDRTSWPAVGTRIFV
jgi:7,8-dihydropterin-6-yl-methyl-4-(beta-D-ribofuranosyl)aminobenzene 5'-phosphate synthase